MTIQPSDSKASDSSTQTVSSETGPIGSGAQINVVLPQAESTLERWVVGLCVGIGIHAAAVGFFYYSTEEPVPILPEMPAFALNIDLLPVQSSPIKEIPDQQMDLKNTDFAPTPVEPEPEPELEEIEEPKPDVKPEVVLPKPKKKKKKKPLKKVELKKPEQTKPPEIERRTASAPVDAPEMASTAEQVGVPSEMSTAQADWHQKVVGHLKRYVKYPRLAKRRNLEGDVVIHLVLNRQGQVLEVELTQSSGHDLLDRGVLKGIKGARSFPRPPEEVLGDTFKFNLPLDFNLNEARRWR